MFSLENFVILSIIFIQIFFCPNSFFFFLSGTQLIYICIYMELEVFAQLANTHFNLFLVGERELLSLCVSFWIVPITMFSHSLVFFQWCLIFINLFQFIFHLRHCNVFSFWSEEVQYRYLKNILFISPEHVQTLL